MGLCTTLMNVSSMLSMGKDGQVEEDSVSLSSPKLFPLLTYIISELPRLSLSQLLFHPGTDPFQNALLLSSGGITGE